MIHFYELPSTDTLSFGYLPFTRSVILILGYKKLPYEIHQITYADIQGKASSLARHNPSSSTNPPKYSIPFIYDSSTDEVVSDSLEIASYLDETYPDDSPVIPPGTRVLQYAFSNNILSNMFALYPILQPQFRNLLSPEVIAKQRRSLGSKILDIELPAEEAWARVRTSFNALGDAFGKQEGVFVMGGDKPSFADFTVVSFVWCINVVYGDNSQEWREVCGWAGGRIGRLCEELKPKEIIINHEAIRLPQFGKRLFAD